MFLHVVYSHLFVYKRHFFNEWSKRIVTRINHFIYLSRIKNNKISSALKGDLLKDDQRNKKE